MPHFAFCITCGNRISIPSADVIRQYCNLHSTAQSRKQHEEDQAKLEQERENNE